MNGQGVISRRGFLRGVGLGAAGLARPVSFTDLMALQADELRKRQMACILLWMAGGPEPARDVRPQARHRATAARPRRSTTAVPGISIAKGWEQTAKVMKDVALVRSMTNKEGNHQRATYQLHTGYVPTGTVKHPNFGCVGGGRAGRPQVRPAAHRQHRRRRPSAPGSSARRSSRSWSRTPSKPPDNAEPDGRRRPVLAAAGPAARPGDTRASSRPAAPTGSATTGALYARRPAWSSRPG